MCISQWGSEQRLSSWVYIKKVIPKLEPWLLLYWCCDFHVINYIYPKGRAKYALEMDPSFPLTSGSADVFPYEVQLTFKSMKGI